jgi:hypothetical protein
MGRWIAPSSGSGVPDPLPEAAHIRHYAWLDHARICADMGGLSCLSVGWLQGVRRSSCGRQ